MLRALLIALMGLALLGDPPGDPPEVSVSLPQDPGELKELLDLMELLEDFGPLVHGEDGDMGDDTDEDAEPFDASAVGDDEGVERDDGP